MTCPFKPTCADRYECASCRLMGHGKWCGIRRSGRCTCRAYEPFEIKPRRRIDLWNTPTTSSGRFEAEKKSGDVFRGARREDGWSFWDAFDSLHKSLLFLLAVASTGLILHSFGVFCR